MISLIVILFHFSYLWFRHLLRLYGLDGFKWPWHWRHLRLGPFERFVELLKLARPRTKPVEPECCADEGLHRHFEGRGLEWPYMLLFKGLGHLWKEFWTMMHKQPRYFLNMQRWSIYIIFGFFVTSITIVTALNYIFIHWLYCIECRLNRWSNIIIFIKMMMIWIVEKK